MNDAAGESMTMSRLLRDHVFSINEITLLIKRLMDESFVDIWVEGEISNFTHHGSGHMYFTLKDRFAQLRCVMFKAQNRTLASVPQAGQLVQALGDISLYQAGGTVQLYVKDIKPAGLGDLHREFEVLKAKLQKEGLFDAERKRPLPFLPKCIGIVTSPTGAAIRDLIHVIRRRFPAVDIKLLPVKVQGEGAGQEIAQAIDDFHQIEPRPDVLIVGRGGGSIEDLWAFNEEVVARAIGRAEIPIISAVGHEIDFTIADFVADVRAATPSAAGELVVPRADELLTLINSHHDRAWAQTEASVREYQLRLDRVKLSTLGKPERFFNDFQQRLEALITTLVNFQQERLASWRHDLTTAGRSAEFGLLRILDHSRSRLALKKMQLLQFNVQPLRNRLEVLAAKMQAFDPKAILARGYSICERSKDHAVVTSYKQVGEGQQVSVVLREGRLRCTVKERKFL